MFSGERWIQTTQIKFHWKYKLKNIYRACLKGVSGKQTIASVWIWGSTFFVESIHTENFEMIFPMAMNWIQLLLVTNRHLFVFIFVLSFLSSPHPLSLFFLTFCPLLVHTNYKSQRIGTRISKMSHEIDSPEDASKITKPKSFQFIRLNCKPARVRPCICTISQYANVRPISNLKSSFSFICLFVVETYKYTKYKI